MADEVNRGEDWSDGDFDDPFKDHPLKKPFRDLRKFPYSELYKVRNVLLSLDIPVFTALETDKDKERYTFQATLCLN